MTEIIGKTIAKLERGEWDMEGNEYEVCQLLNITFTDGSAITLIATDGSDRSASYNLLEELKEEDMSVNGKWIEPLVEIKE